MKRIAERWLKECVEDDAESSILQVWAKVDEDWRVYFALSTTQSLDKAVYEVREDCFVAIDPISLDDMISMVPDESTDRVNRFESGFERTATSGDEVRDRLQGDVRMERAFSTDELRWGSSRPALEFEHWVREDDIPEISDEQRTKAHEVVEDEIGVDLNRYHDHWGNLVIQIEDFRANIEFDDEWKVELNPELVDLGNIRILLERREYGDLLWQDSVDFESDPDNKEGLRRVILSYDGDNHIGFCQVSQATGSSEEIAKVLIDGEVASREDFPVARKVVTQISVGGVGQSQSGAVDDEPPELYPESDLSGEPTVVAGEQVWDERKIDFGGGAASRGWTTEAETAIVDRAFDSIRGDISSTVKVVDPYLDVSDMTDFVDSLNSDIDAWFITSELRNVSQLGSELSKYKSQGRTVEILRIMDENGGPKLTPLHDRFIVTEKSRSWILGTSFNSLDTNVSIISELPMRVTQALDRQFNRWWTDPVEQKDGSKDCNKSLNGTSQI